MLYKRTIQTQLKKVATQFPVVVISGARQVGKTTILKQYNDELNNLLGYITLDHPRIRKLAQTDPELFLQQYPAPLIIDEIQYAPQLFPYLKMRVDENSESGQYFLTGSQMFHLMQNVSESLAGRVAIISLYALSNAEIHSYNHKPFLPNNPIVTNYQTDINAVFDRIVRGSMPKLWQDKTINASSYYADYTQTYIERDIKNLINVKDEKKFLDFMSCIAARTSQELNLSDIGKDVGISHNTANQWLSILTTSGLVYLLKPHSSNTIKRIIKRPKLYFMDTGLACYLSMWENPRALQISAMSGAFFETFVISEIIKSYAHNKIDMRTKLSYYRDNNGREIDLIIADNSIYYPIEIKKSAEPKKDAIKHFSVLDDLKLNRGKGAVICMSPMTLPLDQNNLLLPISSI